ncbi:hypothetical protein QC762_305790 [Podospora pseudocomata]|uniref:DNA polymerase delta subunit 4 n=1 Tax=Podospora pseudocomata TaxID=2093779 RepID=A0ABR0GJ98_9PEZI|nr:hypothetical protein QC762_305790 [Podospora pseudocomata]
MTGWEGAFPSPSSTEPPVSCLKSCKAANSTQTTKTHKITPTFSLKTTVTGISRFCDHSDNQNTYLLRLLSPNSPKTSLPLTSLTDLFSLTLTQPHHTYLLSFLTTLSSPQIKTATMPPRRSTRATTKAASQSKLNFSNKITKPLPSRSNQKDKAVKLEEAITRTATPSPPPSSEPAPEQELSPAEVNAAKVSQAAINRYWKGIEDSRLAKEVHKKHGTGLGTGEKVLRYFDVSSQFGPCVGITRLERWQRAERLGLNPPIEVLAVIVKEGRGEEKAHLDQLLSSTAIGERE